MKRHIDIYTEDDILDVLSSTICEVIKLARYFGYYEVTDELLSREIEVDCLR